MLQTRKIGEYTVTEAGPLEAARVMKNAQKYQALIDAAQAKDAEVSDDEYEFLQALAIWPTIASCTSPQISIDEWMQIPLTTIAQLREAAEILNPSWFVALTPDQEKKTRSRHKKSTNA
jgi:hypothetical protein